LLTNANTWNQSNSNTNSNRHRHPHSDGNCDSHGNCDSYCYSHGYCYSNADSDCHSYTNSNGYGNRYRDSDADRYCKTFSYAKIEAGTTASADLASAAVGDSLESISRMIGIGWRARGVQNIEGVNEEET